MFPELVAIVTAASPVDILSAATLEAAREIAVFKFENVILFVEPASVSTTTNSSSLAGELNAVNAEILLSAIYNPLFNLLCLFIELVFSFVLLGFPIDVLFAILI
jgi:hypothetical protein